MYANCLRWFTVWIEHCQMPEPYSQASSRDGCGALWGEGEGSALGNATCCASAFHPLSQTKSSWESTSTLNADLLTLRTRKAKVKG